jgi:flavin reductase (DIM6/NTAB) family NADH-FMN oxidoreductase RutF
MNEMLDYQRITLDTLTRQERYKLLTGSVIPRPIALVTTLNENGTVNAAPFSQFIIIAADPGLLGISVGPAPHGIKDTLRNIRRTGEFVINTVHEGLAGAVQHCADIDESQVSELDQTGLTPVQSLLVAPPRVADTRIQFECRLERIVEFGDAPNSLVVGRVVLMHARAGLVDPACHVDAVASAALGRIGGRNYCRVREFIAV